MPGTARPMPELCAYFERLIFDQPWHDAEIPSLVFDQPGHGIVGFVASHTRRLRMEGRDLRLACSGQLVAREDFRNRGVGALLMRSYLKGPQDLTITDGATDEVRAMWTKFGGQTNYLASNVWTRITSPVAHAGWAATRRLGRQGGFAARAGAGLDAMLGLRPTPTVADSVSEQLSVGDLVELSSWMAGQFQIGPAYDEAFAAWLLAELAERPERGAPLCRKVSDLNGEPLGWYLAFIDPTGVAQAIQVVAPAAGCERVVDCLIKDVGDHGASAVMGRVDPHLYSAVRRRGFILRRGEWALLHSREPELVNAALRGDALLTRLEGEWWLMPHLLRPVR